MTLSIEKNQFDIDVNRIIFRTIKEEFQGKVYVRFNISNMTPSHSQSLPPPKGDMHSIRPKQTPNLPDRQAGTEVTSTQHLASITKHPVLPINFTYMKMLKVCFFMILGVVSLELSAQVSFGEPEKLNDNWKFVLMDVDNGQSPAVEDKDWQTIDLPHDWSVKQQLSPTLASATGYLPGGIAWYRKSITIPQSKQNGKVYLYFEGVYNRSEVFVNGQSLGIRPNGYYLLCTMLHPT